MLIKNIEVVDRFKELKHCIYRFTRQVNGSLDLTSLSLIQLFLFYILLLFPFTAIFFKSDDCFPTAVSKILRYFLPSSLESSLGVDRSMLYAVGVGVNLVLLGLVASHFVFGSVFSFLTKGLAIGLKLYTYLVVPMVDLAVSGYQDMLDPQTTFAVSLTGTTFCVTTLALVVLNLLTLKFQLRIMRKRNLFWNLDNDIHLYGLLYLVFKSLVISLNGVSASICVLSVAVWVYHRQLSGGCVGKQAKLIEYSLYNYVVAGDVSVLVYLAFGDAQWAFGLWVVLIGCALVLCVLTLYREKTDKLHLPDCGQGPEQFYYFFYSYKQSFKGEEGHLNSKSKGHFDKIYYLHKVACKAKHCYLSSALEATSYTDMEELITRIIQSKKNESMCNRVVYELWNLQLGRKCTTQSIVDKPIDTKQEFTIYCIEKLTKDSEVTIKNSESNKTIISKVFYDLIYEISSYYSQFYEELARTHPKIDLLVAHGTMILSKIDKLKSAYSDLLKSKLINFKMIELYMEFLTNFVGENALDKDDISRLMKAQQNIYFEDISENYLPTVSLYLETGSIENANSQAQKLLHSTRFQLKYKNIADVTYPSVTIEKLKQVAGKELVECKDDPIYSFFRQSEKEYSFTSMVLQERVVRQKKLMVVQMRRVKFSDQKNFLLVSSEFELKLMTRRAVRVKSGGFRSRPLLLHWHDLFAHYLAPNRHKIETNKMLKISTSIRDCIIVVKRLRCLIPAYFILEAQLFVTSELIRTNRSSVLTFRKSLQEKKSLFQFQFQVGRNDDNEKLTYYGLKGNSSAEYLLDKRTDLLPEFKQLQNELVSTIVEQNQRQYDKDIKTYRLFEGELYNVDLEDRQAYNNLFEQHISQSKRIELPDNSSLECNIFIAVVLLGVVLMALSITLIVKFQAASDSIAAHYSQYINIESLLIDFYRILCILRDQASGFLFSFPDFSIQKEMGQSFARIQNLKKQPTFTNDKYTVQFQSVAMSGTLIELVDVMLAHVTELLSSGDFSIIEDIHDACIIQLNDIIRSSQGQIYIRVVSDINSVSSLSNITLYCSLGIVAVLYILMVFYCFQSNGQLRLSFSSLLYISDSEAHMHQENAEKMKYAVEMIRKNFEVDSQNLLVSQTDFKRRKNPKQAIQSREIVYSIAVMATLGLALHLTCLFLFEKQLNTQLANFQTMKEQTISMTSIYLTSSQLTNYVDHTGTLNLGMLNAIRGNLTYLEYNLKNFLFTPEMNSFIATLYFGNSCPELTSNGNLSAQLCAVTTPGFTVVNPFEIGLAIYINRQNYYYNNNLTQDYAHTGVYSGPFVAVLTNLTQYFKSESLGMVGRISALVNLFNGCIIAIDLGYIFAFVVVYYYFRAQFKKIKEILVFFDQKFKSHKTVPEGKDQIEVPDREQSLESSDEEETLLDVQREDAKKMATLSVGTSYKKRSSIEVKKPFDFQQEQQIEDD